MCTASEWALPVKSPPKKVDEMGPVHHVVLYWAVDGGPLSGPLQGLSRASTPAGEYFVLFEPQPLDAVREATVDLVRAGFVVLHSSAPDEERELPADEAVELLARESTWTGKHYYELSATEAGGEVFRMLHERHGDAYRQAHAEAHRRWEEFLQRHPDHVQRGAEWLEALGRWSETGEGEMPKPPRYEGEPPPYEGDVPRWVNTHRWGEEQDSIRLTRVGAPGIEPGTSRV